MKLRNRPVGTRRLAKINTEAVARAESERRRREALVESVAVAVPVAILSARTKAWDEGWEAARCGLPRSANPAM